MPLQNRVTPEGEILALAPRGTYYGNRGGCFHHADKTLKRRHWHSKAWITCKLEFKGRKRVLLQPNRYTELFFLDEVTALAAGHRPCFECRYDRALAFAVHWAAIATHDPAIAGDATTDDGDAAAATMIAAGIANAPGAIAAQYTGNGARRRAKVATMDGVLHAQRLGAKGQKAISQSVFSTLPDGTMIRWQNNPHLICQNRLWRWTPSGYHASTATIYNALKDATVDVLTPPAIVAVISHGYCPNYHHSISAQTTQQT